MERGAQSVASKRICTKCVTETRRHEEEFMEMISAEARVGGLLVLLLAHEFSANDFPKSILRDICR